MSNVYIGTRHHDGMVEMMVGDTEVRMSPAAARDIARSLEEHATMAVATKSEAIDTREVASLQHRQLLAMRRLAASGLAH